MTDFTLITILTGGFAALAGGQARMLRGLAKVQRTMTDVTTELQTLQQDETNLGEAIDRAVTVIQGIPAATAAAVSAALAGAGATDTQTSAALEALHGSLSSETAKLTDALNSMGAPGPVAEDPAPAEPQPADPIDPAPADPTVDPAPTDPTS